MALLPFGPHHVDPAAVSAIRANEDGSCSCILRGSGSVLVAPAPDPADPREATRSAETLRRQVYDIVLASQGTR